jgi:hypothetical protein
VQAVQVEALVHVLQLEMAVVQLTHDPVFSTKGLDHAVHVEASLQSVQLLVTAVQSIQELLIFL